MIMSLKCLFLFFKSSGMINVKDSQLCCDFMFIVFRFINVDFSLRFLVMQEQ